MADDTTANYLRDLGDLIKRSALEARTEREDSAAELERAFKNGRLTAYYEIVSLMQQQAVAFGIEMGDLALEDIDPDRDLL